MTYMPVSSARCSGSTSGKCSCTGCRTTDHELNDRPTTSPLRTVVSGFSRYGDAVRSLPPVEQRKIESVARFVVSSLAGRGTLVHRIELVGQADTDTPRRPSFEMQMSLIRAQQLRTALSAAIDRNAAMLPGPAQLPPFSSRIAWRTSGEGATQLIVPNARSEADRARNRRVEIAVHRWRESRPRAVRRLAIVGQRSPTSAIDRIIQEFLNRVGDASINRKNCYAAGTQVIQKLEQSAPKQLRCTNDYGPQFVASKDYRAPFSKLVRCCAQENCVAPSRLDCHNNANKAACAHCGKTTGPYLILRYGARALMRAVDRAKCVLDQGCVVRAGVLSGICDDKPDCGCAKNPNTPPDEVWRLCPEHWLVIIGYVGDTFVFWDSARSSPLKSGGHDFGLLHYNRTENRLTTGQDMSKMDVNPDGFHAWAPCQVTGDPCQKRYQVLRLQTGGRYKPATGSC